jgi:hypothetical protein
MQAERKEQWLQLCELAANEQDSDKLLDLVKEMLRLLDEKEERLKKQKFETPNSPRRTQDRRLFGTER